MATVPRAPQDATTGAVQEDQYCISPSSDKRKAKVLRLTKYEKAVLISTRIEELEENARPLVEARKGDSFFDIATREHSASLLVHLTVLRAGS